MTVLPYDIAIVGSGPVGMALAWRLRDSGLRIALIEAGGQKHDPATEATTLRATRKTPAAHPEAQLYRRRMLGGASTIWGGRCLPYDALDFLPNANREGWPISKDQVDPWIGPALGFLDAGANVYDEAAFDVPIVWGRPETGVDFDLIERFSLPTNVWTRYAAVVQAAGVTILPNTIVTEVLLDSAKGCAIGVATRDAVSATQGKILAGRIVLAGGGIETARLLLASRSVRAKGLGNDNDLVGRHYMTHLIGDIGMLTYDAAVPMAKLDYRRTTDGVYARTIFSLSKAVRQKAGLPSILWRPNIPPVWDPAHGSAILSAMHVAKGLVQREYAERLNAQGRGMVHNAASGNAALRHGVNILRGPISLAAFAGKWVTQRILAQRKLPSVFLLTPTRRYPMEMNAEQFPDPASRIALSSECDRYGMPLVTLDWQPGAGTVQGIAYSLTELRTRLAQSGIGKFEYAPETIADCLAPQGGHHMGTARMGATPATGVVDTDSTLFACPNLHIAGSAVFPTSGCVNPTLVAVALTLRLAENILFLEKKL